MKILLLSRSRLIIQFVKIASNKLDARLDILEESRRAKEKFYDVVIVDEHFDTLPCREIIPQGVRFEKSVLLQSGVSVNQGCDFSISKPFLPSDIIELLEDSPEREEEEFSVEAEGKSVLDGGELERIKELLDEKERIPLKESSTIENHQEYKKDLDFNPEQFVEMIQSVNPKHLKRVLAGTTITITIKFKGE